MPDHRVEKTHGRDGVTPARERRAPLDDRLDERSELELVRRGSAEGLRDRDVARSVLQ